MYFYTKDNRRLLLIVSVENYFVTFDMLYILFFIFGLIVGSFCNVVILRLKSGESFVGGRSHCPTCRHQLMWYDNMPLLSFVLLHGKCRYCDKKISWQYPLVELSTGLLFALLIPSHFILNESLTWLISLCLVVIIGILVVIFVYDLKYMEIPMIPAWIAIILSMVAIIFQDLIEGMAVLSWGSHTVTGLIAGVSVFLFFHALTVFSHEQWMGAGDAYIALIMGLLLGWPYTLVAFLIAFLSGSVIGVGMMALSRGTLKTQVPFAPFLILGLFCTLLIEIYAPGLVTPLIL